jgi:hypothetical protein
LLTHLVAFLPQALRPGVQACLALGKHIWSKEYSEAYYAAQKEAHSESLATANELETKLC